MSWKVLNQEKKALVDLKINGQPHQACEGQTVAAALCAGGHLVLGHTLKGQHPRGVFCGMGVCHSCLVQIDGIPNQRACMQTVQPGMEIELDED
ncbi:MAG: (2Fe-2S)-binding protein [Desulfarculaceae bacterium]|jgi:predicted molibdopterin-dependent oxidoreductase YjgC